LCGCQGRGGGRADRGVRLEMRIGTSCCGAGLDHPLWRLMKLPSCQTDVSTIHTGHASFAEVPRCGSSVLPPGGRGGTRWGFVRDWRSSGWGGDRLPRICRFQGRALMRCTLLTILMLAVSPRAVRRRSVVAGSARWRRARTRAVAAAHDAQERDGTKEKLVRQRLAEGDIMRGRQDPISVVAGHHAERYLHGEDRRYHRGPKHRPDQRPRYCVRSSRHTLTKELQRYLRNPTVTASSLVRIAVSGSVARPGFYDLPPESRPRRPSWAAAGSAATATCRKTIVRRNAEPL